MNGFVLATCETHKTVEVSTTEVKAILYKYPETTKHHFRFACPIDSEIVIVPCAPRIHDILRAHGVEIEEIIMPPEESGGELPPLNDSDMADLLIDLHEI